MDKCVICLFQMSFVDYQWYSLERKLELETFKTIFDDMDDRYLYKAPFEQRITQRSSGDDISFLGLLCTEDHSEDLYG